MANLKTPKLKVATVTTETNTTIETRMKKCE